MKTAKQLVELFSEMNPDDKVWCNWVTKDEVVDTINNYEYEDKEGNLIEVDKDMISDEFFERVMNSVDSNDSLWDRFYEDLNDTCHDYFSELVESIEEAKEDKELWDKE